MTKTRSRIAALIVAAATSASLAGVASAQEAEGRRDHRRGPIAPGQAMLHSVSPQNGAPGTTVTLVGRFADDTEVMFGRFPVTPTARTARSITFTVPAGRPGPHPIVLKTGGTEIAAGTFLLERGGAMAPGTPPPPSMPPGAVPPPAVPPPGVPPVDMAGPRGPRGRWGRGLVVNDFGPREGPVGTVVTIRGRRFSPDLEVVYGAQAITPSSVTPDAITFAVPRREGDNLIVLRAPGRPDVVVGSFDVAERPHRIDRARLRAERRAAAEQRWKQRQLELAKSAAEREEALRRQEEELQRAREERRRQRLAALRAQWEQRFLAQEDVREELALHADRNARLARMMRLAEAKNNGALAVRVQVLMDAETTRHERRMGDLKAAHARL